MSTIIILAVHGMPPADFPKRDMAEFFRLHAMIENLADTINPEMKARYAALEKKMLGWPRDLNNDPFSAASQEMAGQLGEISGFPVLVGYNEFCAPGLEESLEEAANRKADKIVVVTPMMTRGGEHAEKDIPRKIQEFREKHPGIKVVYAWPFTSEQVAGFLYQNIVRYC